MTGVGGWVGRILWVNLSQGTTRILNTLDYGSDYIGGRGIATRIAWDHIPPGTRALDAENLLMIFTGPLTGTVAPFSGRTTVAGLSPQGYPHEWFSRSSLGGHWGPSLKFAGFDGLVIEGRADQPVYIWIEDGRVEVRSAKHLWGLGSIGTQQVLLDQLGRDVRVLTIGQAGERLSRIATISTETQSAAGQGGFGAVMGSKSLKAVAVRGTGPVYVASPDTFLHRCKGIAREIRTGFPAQQRAVLDSEKVVKYGERWQACTQQCGMRCKNCRFYTRVPGPISGRELSGQFDCLSTLFPGRPDTLCDWDIGFEAGFEIHQIADDYGLNHWDLLLGIVPWLRLCSQAGLASSFDGLSLDFDDPFVWAELLRRIAYREGVGDALAEGGRRAPTILGFGEELADPLYLAWGSAGHWDGRTRTETKIVFPFWLVSALQWAMDTRDPFASSHGYVLMTMSWSPFGDQVIPWSTIMKVGEQIYGSANCVDPRSSYEGKAFPAVWHENRAALKDSVTVNGKIYPILVSLNNPDGVARTESMEGPDFEYHLFTSATGLDLGPDGFHRAGERIVNLDRAVQVRHFDRSRGDDETVIPYFQRAEQWASPLLGDHRGLDRIDFLQLMDEYYALRGWHSANGRPTFTRLRELGLADVATELGDSGLIPLSSEE